MRQRQRSAGVRTGIDRLAERGHPLAKGRRIGLVTNPTGITSTFESSVNVCAGLQEAKLTALFACEHGIRGQRQAGVRFDDEWDEALGIPVFSLYGKHKKPTKEMLDTVDTVLFDIQDVGVRFYTYLSTLVYVMEACAEHGKGLLVLDRPNPLGGLLCEGGLLEPGFESMVGAWRMPILTGMTIGELALCIHAGMGGRCDVGVVEMEGWNRSMEFPDTRLPWMMPSPNMPTIDTVRVYAGTCLFEGTNVSEGRGTTRPFEWIGAPWIDGEALAAEMNSLKLPGVHFHPVYATPMFSKHQGELCGGVRLFVTDPGAFRAVSTGLHLLHQVVRMFPERFEWLPPFREGGKPFIDLLTGSERVRTELGAESGLRRILDAWQADAERWKEERQPFLRYGVQA
jgi:uncharacterized protein YbbC (DUF1343 family)